MAELYVVEFKGSRREYAYNAFHHTLTPGEHVIVQIDHGEEIGQLSKKIDQSMDFSSGDRPRSILRQANADDIKRLADLQKNEIDYKNEVITLIRKHGLVMKIVDVECRFDGNKITFYFTADHRVDFRSLVRDLASRYRTRIELRQIGVRDEARRIDGYGICGLRQCCNGHIRDFAPISTQQARVQDLSLNPTKISGNCGRLLCCLRFELDLYTQTKKQFPSIGTAVRTTHGDGRLDRIDVFKAEAVIVGGDGQTFRVTVDEIKSVGDRRGKATVQPNADQPTREEAAELKRLDEPDSSS